jgi:hypothetical protein
MSAQAAKVWIGLRGRSRPATPTAAGLAANRIVSVDYRATLYSCENRTGPRIARGRSARELIQPQFLAALTPADRPGAKGKRII